VILKETSIILDLKLYLIESVKLDHK